MNRNALLLPLLLASSLALAQGVTPDVLLKGISDDVMQSLQQDKALQSGDARKLAELVEAKVLPYFDFRHATQLAMGANWRHATPEQQEALTREFRTLLVRTYSGAIASYRGRAIEFLPLRAAAGDENVTVRSRVHQPGAEALAVEYDLQKDGTAWKIYDVRIGGMSLVATYRSTFSEEVRNHGIDGLISSLAAKNHPHTAL
jgi:phospholipid transport system substrate-binding protein